MPDDHPNDDEDEPSSDNDEPADENRSTVDEIRDALDGNDGDPMVILDHREWLYILAEWYDSDELEKSTKY